MTVIKVAHITTIDMSLRYLLLNQLESIQCSGYTVTGISSPGPDVATIRRAGMRHIGLPMSRNFTPQKDLVALWRLYMLMRQERFTIVHTHNPKPGLLGQLAARMAGVPIVVNTLHGFYFHENMHPFWRLFYIAVEKVAARCSDVILSQNREDIQTAIREHICPARKIRYLGNGIDLQRFDRTQFRAEHLLQKRQELGLPMEAPIVGFVGRLVAEKGILELLKAIHIIIKQIPQTRFLIIGPMDYEKADALTPAIAHENGVGDACLFTGIRHDMPELYALMDVFVLPSYREGFPRSPMEASAMGVPCVATDIRGCREAIKHGQNGLLVPLGDIQALAEAILTLLNDSERAHQMGENGKRMAQEQFDEQLVFKKVNAEYARLLTNKGLPVPAPVSASSGVCH